MLYELITFLHLIGVALGFGGAMVSDAIFFSSIKDKQISRTEFRFLQLAGSLVWTGLAILILSGIGLVSLNPDLLSSPKFLIKMVVVLVIVLNGIVFHAHHLPHLGRHINMMFHLSETFTKKSLWLTVSGGISVVSWFTAALLGSLPGLPYTFTTLFGMYILLLFVAVFGGVGMNWLLFRTARR